MIELSPNNSTQYLVKESIENVLLANGSFTTQQLSMPELLRNARIAEKIKSGSDEILLEDSEFETLKRAFSAYRGFGKFDVELLRRIEAVETVEVQEKK